MRVFFCLLFSVILYEVSAQALLPDNIIEAFPDYGSTKVNLPVTIDVLNNDSISDCSGSPVLTVAEAPVHGSAGITGQSISYTPAVDFQGNDSLVYRIECGIDISYAKIYITVHANPDNVLEADCWVVPGKQDWNIQQVQQIGDVATTAAFVVGDLNGDGFPDVVAYGNKNRTSIKIFWGPTFTEIKEITNVNADSNTSLAIAKVKTSDDPAPVYESFIFYRNGSTLRAVRPDGSSPWATNPNCRNPGMISLADFNRDGWTEVYVGNQIYDAATGKLLCDGGTGYNSGTTLLVLSNAAQSMAADILGDPDLELVAGNQIFKVDIDRSVTTPKPLTLISSVTPPVNCPNDGITVVADFNNDGKPEVLVRRRQTNSGGNQNVHLYLWSPHTSSATGKLLASTTDTHVYFGVPFVGDIDGDGKVEIVTLGSNGVYQSQSGFKARKYNESTNSLDLFWDINHFDQSGATGMTLFDFNLDGISEIVYRDESELKIINGSLKSHKTGADTTVYTLNSFTSYSETFYEYPIVADIYGNQSSAILVTSDLRGPRASGYDGNAKINIYTSDPSMPWAPARPVWNQYAYNPVVVNKDLTIPREMFDRAIVYAGKDSISGTPDDYRPYNNFLQQAPVFNKYGVVVLLAPDYFIYPDYSITYYTGDSLVIHFKAGNQGDAAVTPFHVCAYANDYDEANLLGIETYNHTPSIGSSTSYDLVLYNISLQDIEHIILSVNDKGDAHVETPECDITNNRLPIPLSEIVVARDDFARTLPERPVVVDLLLNDYIPASCANPVLSVITGPLNGSAVLNGDKITYTPNAGFLGKDSLTYKVVCGENEGIANVYIMVLDFPDNIDDADCYIDPKAADWGISLHKTYQSVLAIQCPFAGDLDGDGYTDIFAKSGWSGSTNKSHSFTILKGPDFSEAIVNPTVATESTSEAIARIKWDETRDTAIVVLVRSDNFKLIAYNAGGNQLWISDKPVYIPGYASVISANAIGFADFNNDGYSEVYVGNQIFDAVTGKELCNGGDNNKGLVLYSNAAHGLFSIAQDVTGDLKPELCTGSQVYDVNIISRTDPALNTMTVVKEVIPMYNSVALHRDGATVIADFDNDGELEILVQTQQNVTTTGTTGYLYIWKPSTEDVVLMYNIDYATNRNVPFVGDINGDGKLEIVMLTNGTYRYMRAFAINGSSLTELWRLPHNDTSGSTGLTLFDFNQDGISEIVYRDETRLRVINGSLKSHITGQDTIIPYDLFSTPAYSGTQYEYPIVADVDGDGHAEIIATSSQATSSTGNPNYYNYHNADLRIYKGLPDHPWAPARKVWNQYMYNAVNVNDDLTIPRYIVSPASVFPGKDGILNTSDDVRPYNTFLQQQTVLNKNGNPLWVTPDIEWSVSPVLDYYINGDSLVIKVDVINSGDAPMQAPVSVSAYKNSVSAGNLIMTTTYPAMIDKGERVQFSFKMENFSAVNSLNELIIRLNDRGEGKYYYQECDTFNNSISVKVYASGYDDYYGAYNPDTGASGSFGILDNDVAESVQMTSIKSVASSAGSSLTIIPGAVESLSYHSPAGFTGIDTIRYMSSGMSAANVPVIVSGTAYIYVYSNYLRSCYDISGTYPAIRIEDIDYDVTVDWVYNAGDLHGKLAGSDANVLTSTVTSGKDLFILEALVRFNVSDIAVPAFNNNVHTPFTLDIVPFSMYWNKLSGNSNWNDPANWTDASGNILNTVPLGCTSVHIPGNASNYPSLDSLITIREIYYGDPECDSIIYHFGGEVAKPHYLSYNKAFVHYNFGYYNSQHALITDGDSHSASPMDRDRWYALAAPLKSIVTGDFSLGGFPNTWQRGFQTSRDRTSDLIGEWYNPENTVALEIGSRQNYAISLHVPGYSPAELGENDHKKLDNLRGIFELPYFENELISQEHRIHTYYPASKTSRFLYYYYEIPGMPIEESTYNDFMRSDESYRFIFEDNLNQDDLSFSIRIPVMDKNGDNIADDVMVGNPFISSFDFESFYAQNAAKIENYYRLYANGAFETYTIGMNLPLIAPMQAFFVKPKGAVGTETELRFSPSVSVARSSDPHQLRSGTIESEVNGVDDLLKINVSNNSGNSWMIVSRNKEIDKDIVRMFSNDKPAVPQIYALGDSKEKTAVQYLEDDGSEITLPLGIRSNSGGHYEISFENIDHFYSELLLLMDRELNVIHDLFKENSYSFEGTTGSLDSRIVLLIGKQYNPTGVDDNLLTGETKVYTFEKMLFVNSGGNIKDVEVFNSQGLRVFSESLVNSNYFQHELSVAGGIYLVSVKLENGDTIVEKVIMK